MALAEVVPFVLLMLGTLGGLYFGFVTTTEAAVVGCVLSVGLGIAMGNLSLQGFAQVPLQRQTSLEVQLETQAPL